MLFLLRILAACVIGWTGGAALGLLVSRVVYGGTADQLPILTAPLGVVAFYALSFLVVRPRW